MAPGTQAPSIWPVVNVSSVWAFSWGRIDTSPPPCLFGRKSVVGEPRPEGDVLGVAELRRGELLAAQVRDRGDLRLDDEVGAA